MDDTLSSKQKVISNLQSFGLTEVQSRIYSYLLFSGTQSVLSISKSLKIPRTSIYDNIEKLVEGGYVERIIEQNSQRFKAYGLDRLKHQIEDKKESLDRLEASFVDIKNNIHQLASIPGGTNIKYYTGVEGMKQMMWNTLGAKGEIVGYSIFGRVEIVGKSYEKRYAKEFRKRKLSDKVIVNNIDRTLKLIGKEVINDTHHQDILDIKYVDPSKVYISGDTTIYNDVFAQMYWQDGEVVGVEMHNAEFVKFQRSMFDLLWTLAAPIQSVI